MKYPTKPNELRAAVNAAHGMLTLHQARKFGLVKGGPKIEVRRCREILRRGKLRGYVPEGAGFELFVHALQKNLTPSA